MKVAFASSIYSRYLLLFNDETKEIEDKFSGLVDALFKLLAIAFGVGVLLFCFNIFVHLLGIPFGALNAGTFGDFLGGVLNPILAFLTFIGLIFTIIIQRKELHLARFEYSKSAEALVNQSDSAKEQNIDNTFFNLISLHNNITNELVITVREDAFGNCYMVKPVGKEIKEKSYTGRETFTVIRKLISRDAVSGELVKQNYDKFQVQRNNVVSHYFRNLYQILNYISSSGLDEKHQRKYARIVRSQLSSDELIILYFNCLSPQVDSGKFLALISKFSMLEHAPIGGDASIKSEKLQLIKSDIDRYMNSPSMDMDSNGAFGKNQFVESLSSIPESVEIYFST